MDMSTGFDCVIVSMVLLVFNFLFMKNLEHMIFCRLHKLEDIVLRQTLPEESSESESESESEKEIDHKNIFNSLSKLDREDVLNSDEVMDFYHQLHEAYKKRLSLATKQDVVVDEYPTNTDLFNAKSETKSDTLQSMRARAEANAEEFWKQEEDQSPLKKVCLSDVEKNTYCFT